MGKTRKKCSTCGKGKDTKSTKGEKQKPVKAVKEVKYITSTITFGFDEERQIPHVSNELNVTRIESFSSPTQSYRIFMFFFRNLMSQPFLRRYFINKYNPNTFYRMVHLPLLVNNSEKINEIERIIDDHTTVIPQNKSQSSKSERLGLINRTCNPENKFIFDIAEQLPGGGHYTSLSCINGKVEYMDPDPFFYGSTSTHNHDFHEMVRKYPNPVSIYGSHNFVFPKQEGDLTRSSSIQNVHKFDIFCQSWSLYFLTLAGRETKIPSKILFQSDSMIGHTSLEEIESIRDPEQKAIHQSHYDAHIETFPFFIQNLNFLFDFWDNLFKDNVPEIDDILSRSKFKNWNSASIREKLEEIRVFVNSLNHKDFKTYMMDYNPTDLNSYMDRPVSIKSQKSQKSKKKRR